MAFDNPRGPFGRPRVKTLLIRALALAVVMAGSACASGSRRPPVGTPDPDKFLFERGTEELNDKDWFTAREYFSQLVDSYPQSEHRGDAKLGIGDTYLGEGTSESFVLAINEFREFLQFYPTHRRAYYAQYKLAMSHFYQMRDPMRDQTETIEAIRELTTFVERYPNSPLIQEGRARLREARDRLGEHELGVAIHYHRVKFWPATIERIKPLLERDPQFTRRDAALYYLADSYEKIGRPAEALPHFERLVKEFETSEFLERAQARVEALRAAMDKNTDGKAGQTSGVQLKR